MATCIALRDLIGQFTREPKAERDHEHQAVVEEVRAKVLKYGLTEKDIFPRKRARPGAKKNPSLAPKCQDPKINKTWTERAWAPDRIKGNNGDRFVIKS